MLQHHKSLPHMGAPTKSYRAFSHSDASTLIVFFLAMGCAGQAILNLATNVGSFAFLGVQLPEDALRSPSRYLNLGVSAMSSEHSDLSRRVVLQSGFLAGLGAALPRALLAADSGMPLITKTIPST